MPTFASFAPTAAAALLWQGGFYSCEDSVRWDSHYQANAIASFEEGYAAQRTTRYHLNWAPDASQPPLLSVSWSQLPVDMKSLPPPDELGFGIRMPRSPKGGTILLIPTEGELLQIAVKKPAVMYRKFGDMVWVAVKDPAQRARLIEGGGWRFAAIDSKGKVAAQGPINLPDRAGMEIRYRPLAETLRAKAAAYETACVFEPQTEMR